MESEAVSREDINQLFEEYRSYFGSVQVCVRREQLLRNLSEKHIFYNHNSNFEGVRAEPVKAERRGALVHFRVDIGGFTLTLVVLNLKSKAPKTCRRELHRKLTTVVQERMSVRASSYVSKRLGFTDTSKALREEEDGPRWEINSNPREVKELVKECALAKLCAALGVGVPVGSPDHPFDLVCYEDSIEFFMEYCQPISECLPKLSAEIEERLKYCVGVMHSFHLIHKDIKPANILVTGEGTVMLADFEISTHVKETAG